MIKAKKSTLFFIFLIIISVIVIAAGVLIVTFETPTYSNNTFTNNVNPIINISITSSSGLDEFKWNWNGTNYSFYNDSLVLMMNFDNVTLIGEAGSKIVDISRSTNNGTISGAVWNVTGKYGGAFNFDGNDQITTLKNASGDFTLMAWINPDNAQPVQAIIAGKTAAWYRELAIFQGNIYSTSSISGDAYQAGNLQNKTWQHIAGVVTQEGANVRRQMYLNGVSVYNAVVAGTISVTTTPYTIGATDVPSQYFNGAIDEARVYNRSLSASEILQIYKSNLNKYDTQDWLFYSNQSNLSDGAYTYSASAKDILGDNISTETRTLNIDTVPSYFSISLNSPANNTYTASSTLESNFTVIGNKANYLCNIFLNDIEDGTDTSVPNNTAAVITANSSLTEGSHNWSINCTAYAGDSLINFSETRIITLDTTLPNITFVSPTETSWTTIGRNFILVNITVNDTNFKNLTVFLYNSSYGSVNETSTTSSSIFLNFTNLTDQRYYFNATAYDLANNSNSTNTRNVLVDLTSPKIDYVAPTLDNNSVKTSAEINITVTNASDLNIFKFEFNGTNYTFYNNSLILMFNFDNITSIGDNYTQRGNLTVDASKYGNNGTIYGATYNVTGKYGGAWEFDGINDYISVPNFNVNATQLSVAFWFNTRDSATTKRIIEHTWGTGAFTNHISSGNVNIGFMFSDESSSQINTAINANTWYYLVQVYNGTHSLLYLNGAQKSSSSDSKTLTNVSTELQIGSVNYPFNGTIDEVRIWNRSLSANEILQMYKSNFNKYDTDKWQFYSNQSNLTEGNYTYAAYAIDDVGNSNMTGARDVEIDLTNPKINFTTPTTNNNSFLNSTNIYINLSSSDANNHYIFADFDKSNLLWLRFEDYNSTHTLDNSSYNNNGDIIGATSTVNGKFEKGFGFDGDDYIRTNTNILNTNVPFTVSVWSKPTPKQGSLLGIATKLTTTNPTGGSGFGIIHVATGNMSVYFYNSSGTRNLAYGSNCTYPSWCHSVITYNGSHVLAYSNNILSSIQKVGDYSPATAEYLDIGKYSYFAGGYANGTIDEILIFNRSLTQTEIFALYNASQYNYTNNFTNLADGIHTFTGYAVDAAGNKNQTEQWQATIDTLKPNATLLSPANNTFTTNLSINLTANITDNIGIKNATLWVYNLSGIYNSTIVTYALGITQTIVGFLNNFIDGIYYWFYEIFDWAGNSYTSENRTLTIDTIPPKITIDYPANNSNSTDYGLNVNYSVYDINLDSCWWTNNSGLTNISASACANLSWAWIEGMNNVTVYANDSAGNENSSSVSFTIDNTPPILTIISPDNSYTSPFRLVNLLYNINDPLTGINNCSLYTDSIKVLETYKNNFSYSFPLNKVYTWYINCSDKVNNTAVSGARTITIQEGTTTPPAGGGGGGSGSINSSITYINQTNITTIIYSNLSQPFNWSNLTDYLANFNLTDYMQTKSKVFSGTDSIFSINSFDQFTLLDKIIAGSTLLLFILLRRK